MLNSIIIYNLCLTIIQFYAILVLSNKAKADFDTYIYNIAEAIT